VLHDDFIRTPYDVVIAHDKGPTAAYPNEEARPFALCQLAFASDAHDSGKRFVCQGSNIDRGVMTI
jgi:hypothetical protein